MREIKLQNGKSCLIDEDDYLFIQGHRWFLDGSGRYVIARAREGGKRVTKMIHRVILGIKDPRVFVDHLNRNTLDNRRSNLRVCNNSLNQANRSTNKNKTRGQFKGVYYRPKKKAWVSEITCLGKRFYLGFFKSEIKAARAYNKKAKELFGSFALLNQITNGGK